MGTLGISKLNHKGAFSVRFCSTCAVFLVILSFGPSLFMYIISGMCINTS